MRLVAFREFHCDSQVDQAELARLERHGLCRRQINPVRLATHIREARNGIIQILNFNRLRGHGVLPSSRHEHIKVTLNPFAIRLIKIVAQIIIANNFSHAKKFLERMASPLGLDGQVKQFQSTKNSTFRLFLVAFPFPAVCTRNFASNIQHLERKRHLSPSASSQTLMLCILYLHRALTISVIASLVAGFSTPRLRLPRLGRILMRESNSKKSSPSISG